MNTILQFLPGCLYLVVGLISLTMARKNLFARKLLPFQAKAAATSWTDLDRGLQVVVIALMRLSGLGFLVVALLLIASPIVDVFSPNPFMRYAVPLVSFVYCSGLGLINYGLRSQTNAETPWKGSLYAALLVLLGVVISFFRP